MASTKATTAKKPKRETTGEMVKRFDGRNVKQPAGIAFLMRQHREVEDYFEAFEKAQSDEIKGELAHKICLALTVHAQIEEELLYPPAHEQLDDEDMVDEAIVEHAGAKNLIAQIQRMQPGDHLYDAKVKVLSEYIKHHVEEEERELFPEIRAETEIDLEALGADLKKRSNELMKQMNKEGRASPPDSELSAESAHSLI